MESSWSGTGSEAFFSTELFDKNRKLQIAENEFTKVAGADYYYVIGYDVGRKGCPSVATVTKVFPQSNGISVKALVNMHTNEDMPFDQQALEIKKLYYKYKARRVVIDGNGLIYWFI